MFNSLRFRFALVLIGLAIGPALLVSPLIGMRYLDYVEEQSLALLYEVANSVESELRAFLRAHEDELTLLGKISDLATIEPDAQRAVLGKQLLHQQMYQEIALLNREGHEKIRLSRTDVILDEDLVSRAEREEFLIPIADGEIFVSPIRYDETVREPLITISLPVFDLRSGEIAFILVADLRLSTIWELMASTHLQEEQDVYVVDQSGRVVAHKNPSVVLRGTTFRLPEKAGRALGLSGDEVMLATDRLQYGNQKLFVVAEQPVSKAFETYIVNMRITGVTIVVTFLFAVALALFATSQIVRPIEVLATASRAVSAGDFSQRMEVHSRDEVGQLALAFNQMTGDLEEYRDHMQGLVRSRTNEVENANLQLQQEIAERRKTEAHLEQALGEMRAIFEAIPDLLFKVDGQGRIVDYRSGMGSELYVPPDQFLHKRIDAVLPPNVGQRITKAIAGCHKQRSVVGVEYSLPLPSGQRHYEARMTPLGSEQTIVIIRDITERKQVENRQQALVAELETKNVELERFTYTVSHDLKSPLITIKGFLGFLEQDAMAGNMEQVQSDILRIGNAADRMHQLLDELLELSRIGRVVNPPEAVSLGELVDEVVNLARSGLVDRRVTLEIAPELPVIYGDRVRLREVIENLLDNAVKFMGDQPNPCVQIGVRCDETEQVLFVRDNGTGIDPRYQKRVFDLFDKLDPQSEGSGIGLAIVRRIIEVSGGRIWVESDGEGQGSTFCFTLPDSAVELDN